MFVFIADGLGSGGGGGGIGIAAALRAAPSGASKNVGTGVNCGCGEFLIVRLLMLMPEFVFVRLRPPPPPPPIVVATEFFLRPLVLPEPVAPRLASAERPSSDHEARHLLVKDLRFEGVPVALRSETDAYGDWVGNDGDDAVTTAVAGV